MGWSPDLGVVVWSPDRPTVLRGEPPVERTLLAEGDLK
jgi:hypothetical protein